ncbi:MAG: hypothetical protein R3F39_10230 [Myxococcota bacterium]
MLSGSQQGLVLRSADGTSSLRALGLFQFQLAQDWVDGAPDAASFFVHRARVGLSGNLLGGDLRTLFVGELGGGDPRLLFLSVDYTVIPDRLAVRVGQFKRPFSRPFLTLASQLAMIDRPLTAGPGAFGDGVDLGVMLHDAGAGPLEYAVGVFSGAGPGAVTDPVHPLIAARVGYGTAGLNPYSESDLEGGPPRFGIAVAGIVDFDADGDDTSFTSGLVDLMFKAEGFTLTSAVTLGYTQRGRRWPDQRLNAVGHYTQVGYVVGNRVEPVVRCSFLLPRGEGANHHDLAAGANLYIRGQAFKWQSVVSVRLQPRDGSGTRDVSLQSQLSLSF